MKPRIKHSVATGFHTVYWWFSSVLGGQDYQNYLDHQRRRHPNTPVLSQREYWRQRYAEADRNPSTRCC